MWGSKLNAFSMTPFLLLKKQEETVAKFMFIVYREFLVAQLSALLI